MASWSDLSGDLLDEIVRRLEDDPVHVIRFGAVCRSWRSSALSHRLRCGRRRPRTQIPWLHIPSPESENDQTESETSQNHRHFYSLTEQKAYQIPLPQIPNLIIQSSSHGFLIAIDAVADLHVINPLSGAHFPLPPTSTLPGVAAVGRDPSSGQITFYVFDDGELSGLRYMRRVYSRKAVLLVSHQQQQQQQQQPQPSAAGVALMHINQRCAAFAKQGDSSWTALHFPMAIPPSNALQFPTANFFVGGDLGNVKVDDVIFHKGRLYAFSERGTFAVDLTRPSDRPIMITGRIKYYGHLRMRSLVESLDGNDLFIVSMIYKVTGTDTMTTGFVVSKLDQESGGKWEAVQSLGDFALFFGSHPVFSLCDARSPPFLSRNCIYFTGDFENGGWGLGVFDLGDGSIKQLDLGIDIRHLRWSLPLWFTPSLALPLPLP